MSAHQLTRYSNTLKGVTLVELVISIVIIGAAMGGMLSAFGNLSGSSANGLYQARQIALAQLYLDEILSKYYSDDTGVGGIPASTSACSIGGADAGESRGSFDDVDDYHGLSEVPNFSNGAFSGSSLYNQYWVSVRVVCEGSSLIGAATKAKVITVTVRAPDNSELSLAAYKGNF